jgi:hypothetical protein
MGRRVCGVEQVQAQVRQTSQGTRLCFSTLPSDACGPASWPCSAFVVSTACAGFALGSDEAVAWERLAWTAAGTWGAAACANTLNQVCARPAELLRTCLSTVTPLAAFLTRDRLA